MNKEAWNLLLAMTFGGLVTGIQKCVEQGLPNNWGMLIFLCGAAIVILPFARKDFVRED